MISRLVMRALPSWALWAAIAALSAAVAMFAYTRGYKAAADQGAAFHAAVEASSAAATATLTAAIKHQQLTNKQRSDQYAKDLATLRRYRAGLDAVSLRYPPLPAPGGRDDPVPRAAAGTDGNAEGDPPATAGIADDSLIDDAAADVLQLLHCQAFIREAREAHGATARPE